MKNYQNYANLVCFSQSNSIFFKGKTFGEWEDLGTCQEGNKEVKCGPESGEQVQKRKCTDGTIDKCQDDGKSRKLPCIFQNCEKTFGNWSNSGDCIADEPNKSCGPGTQLQTRECINGMVDLCTDEDERQTISCNETNTKLPDCKGIKIKIISSE